MRELLTPALAAVNPKAYIAHFRRLDDEARRHYLGTLTPAELKAHFRTVGETATVGLFLTLTGPDFQLEATVGGATLGEASAGAAGALQARALALGAELEVKAVSGMVSGGSLSRLGELERALAAVGWSPRTLVLAGDSGGDDCAPALGWSMRGSIGEVGSFYMPSESLVWSEREHVEALLRELAGRTGATLDVRVA
ncbi:MAG: hypothetical protein ACOZQL_22150 [Myxococcota bacterium]